MSIFQLEQKWYKLSNDDKFEIIRGTIWDRLSEYDAEREQGDGIADFANELAESNDFIKVLENFNGQKSSDADTGISQPMILVFLQNYEKHLEYLKTKKQKEITT